MKATGVTPATGPSSTSFQVFLAGALPGLITLFHGLIAGGQTPSQKIASILGGSGLTGIAAAFKLLHDHGIHVATIQQAGSDIAADIPQLKHDSSIAAAFAEQDFPAFSQRLDALEVKAASIVAPLAPDAAAIETVVRQVLAGIAPAPAPTPPA